MALAINNKSLLSDIQKEFNIQFPAWKMEFAFRGDEHIHSPASYSGSFPFIKISEFYINCDTDLSYSIEDSMTAEEIEIFFRNKIRIPISLFNKTGAYWVKSAKRNKEPLNSHVF